MTFFKPDPPKKHLPQNSVLFIMDSSAGDVFFLTTFPVFWRKTPLPPIFEVLFFLCGFLLGFPFEFMYFIVQETVVFIDIPANCIQHKFLIYFFCRSVIKPPEFFVFFYVPKVPFCLYGSDLAVQYPPLALYVGVGFFL